MKKKLLTITILFTLLTLSIPLQAFASNYLTEMENIQQESFSINQFMTDSTSAFINGQITPQQLYDCTVEAGARTENLIQRTTVLYPSNQQEVEYHSFVVKYLSGQFYAEYLLGKAMENYGNQQEALSLIDASSRVLDVRTSLDNFYYHDNEAY